jgi:hypothetical protein
LPLYPKLCNSYKLENLDGSEIEGTFSSQRLREFIPQEGTQLAKAQRELEEQLAKEEAERENGEGGVEEDKDDEEEEDTAEEVDELEEVEDEKDEKDEEED